MSLEISVTTMVCPHKDSLQLWQRGILNVVGIPNTSADEVIEPDAMDEHFAPLPDTENNVVIPENFFM